MKTLQSLFIFLILVSVTSCAWIGRDYYFENEGNSEGWTKSFKEGEINHKSGAYPDTMTYTYESDSLELSFKLGYQELTVFGPVIIPVIPLPWDYPDNLSVVIKIASNSPVFFDFTLWKVKSLETNLSYSPVGIMVTEDVFFQDYSDKIPTNLKVDGRRFVILLYPVKFSEVEHIELSFGGFYIDTLKITPQKMQLKKIKGNWHYIQFTL